MNCFLFLRLVLTCMANYAASFFFQLCLCKEQVKKEVAVKNDAVASKNEALKQQASTERMLHIKSGVNCELYFFYYFHIL